MLNVYEYTFGRFKFKLDFQVKLRVIEICQVGLVVHLDMVFFIYMFLLGMFRLTHIFQRFIKVVVSIYVAHLIKDHRKSKVKLANPRGRSNDFVTGTNCAFLIVHFK